MKLNARQYWYINAALTFVILWLVYAIWYAPRKDAWQFIPDNAFLVIESSTMQASLFVENDTAASILSEVPFLSDAIVRLKELTKDLNPKKETEPFLDKKLISYSIHREAKSNLEYIVYLPLKNNDKHIRALQSNNAANKRVSTQTTEGVEITRIRPNDDTVQEIAYFIHDDFLICSRSVILLEAVIGKIKSHSPALDKIPFTESRQQLAHMYFRTRNLLDVADLLPTQLSPNLRSYFRNIVPFNPDLIFNKADVSGKITGYVASKTKIEVPFISAFSLQRSSRFSSLKWIPENTAFFLRTGFDNPAALGIDLNVYLKDKDKELYLKKDSVNNLIGKDINGLFDLLGKEAILCEMETIGNESAKRVALFHSKNINNLLSFTEGLSKAAESFQPFRVQSFSVLNRTVQKLEIKEFPALLFGSSFSGFPECYFTTRQDYLIIANSQKAMEDYLADVSMGRTWRNSARHKELRMQLNQNAQITAVISPQRIWNNIYFSLPSDWQQSVLKHENHFKNMRLMAIENIAFKGQFGTKVHIQKNKFGKQRFDNQLLLQKSISVAEKIVGTPRIIVNPKDNSEEVLLQLPSSVTLFDAKGRQLNSLPTEELLTETNKGVDFYQSGRLQYLTNSRSQAFIIDRESSGVRLKKVYESTQSDIIATATFSKEIFVANVSGEIYRLTSTKKATQIALKKKLLDIVDIALITRDNLLLLAVAESNGTLHLFYTQNGVEVRGFPMVATKSRPVKILSVNDRKGNPVIQVISELGEIKQVDLNGELITNEARQMARRSRSTAFDVVEDQQNRDWLLTQRFPSGVIIYNNLGEQLLEVETPYYQTLNVKFFDLGNDLRIITIFDGKTTLLYDLRGQQIGDKPLNATAPPYLTFESNYNKLLIYNPNGNILEKWGVKVE
ncbi:MAG: hypothetical protein QMB24_01350 [Spirosomataceae bacterium]